MDNNQTLNDDLVKHINVITNYDTTKILQAFQSLSYYFSIIPVHRNHSDQKRNKSPVERDWTRWCFMKRPFEQSDFVSKNAGITGGYANKLIVVDIDNHDLFAQYLSNNGFEMPETFVVKSGGKSLHHYYRLPEENNFFSRTVRVEGVNVFDVIASGRQVLAPGSIHPDTGRVYTIASNREIAPAPDWLLKLASRGDIDEGSKRVADQIAKMSSVLDLGQLPHVDIDALSIPDKKKLKILISQPKGTRSEVEMGVINALVHAGCDDISIHSIFETYAIGEKNREAGPHRFARLNRQIAVSRVFCAQDNRSQALDIITFGEIEDEDPQMEYIIEDLWPKYDPLMLLGKGGVGKSLFALDMVLHLVMPAPDKFLGRFKINGGNRVLILQAENTVASVRKRQRSFFNANPIPTELRDSVMFVKRADNILINGSFENELFREEIMTLIERTRPDILLLDPLISYHGADENNNQAMREVLDTIRSLAWEHKVTPFIIHHQGKGAATNSAGGRGASAIGDFNAVSLELKSGKDGTYELEHGKSRDTASFGSLILNRNENLRYSIVDKPVKETADTKIMLVLKAIHAAGGAVEGQKRLVELINNELVANGKSVMSSNTIRSWIDKASTSNHIISTGSGNLLKYAVSKT